MKATSALVLAACLFACHQAESVSECNKPGQIAVVVDGLTKKDGKKILKSLSDLQISALITVGKEMLVKDNKHIIEKIKASKHEIGYHYTTEKDLISLTEKEVLTNLDLVKNRLRDLHGIELKYVQFPHTDNAKVRGKFASFAEKASLITINHNLYIGGNDFKDTIVQTIFNPEDESYIALLEGTTKDTNRVEKALRSLRDHARRQKFTLTRFATCATGSPNREKPVREDTDELSTLDDKTSVEIIAVDDNKVQVEETKKRSRVKEGVLVNPHHIKGYKSEVVEKIEPFPRKKGEKLYVRKKQGEVIVDEEPIVEDNTAKKQKSKNNEEQKKSGKYADDEEDKKEAEKKEGEKKSEEKSEGQKENSAVRNAATLSIGLAILAGIMSLA